MVGREKRETGSGKGQPLDGAALPDFVRDELEARGLIDAFGQRSVAQQEHNVRRILRAQRSGTVQRRLDQMLDELDGGFYMKRAWAGR